MTPIRLLRVRSRRCRPVPVFLLEGWYAAGARFLDSAEPPPIRVTWKELERGIAIEDFRIDNVPARIRKLGDLWKPLNEAKGRFRLEAYL